MIRWKFLLPRLGILLFLVLLVNLLAAPLCRYVIVRSAEAVTGASVDMQKFEFSLWQGKVRLTDLQIADPNRPMHNLLQADVVEFELNPGQLLHRRWVFERARMQRVQFGTPRTESGKLNKQDVPATEPSSIVVDYARQRVQTLGKEWARQMQANLTVSLENNLETVQFANELLNRWPDELRRQRQNANALRLRARTIQEEVQHESSNPLRDLERFRNSVLETQQLIADFQIAQQEVHALSSQFKIDQQSLRQASLRDQKKILNATETFEIRPDQLSQFLLSEQKADLMRETVAWLKWFRATVPDAQKDFRPVRSRGFDVRFRDRPTLLFKSIELEGEGRLAGQEFSFAGFIGNVSSSPRLLDEPTSFEFRGNGHAQVFIFGTIDRRGPQKIDVINISCPQIAMPARTLGQADTLVVDMAPANMGFCLRAKITDDHLVGQIQLQQNDVVMNVASISPITGATNLAESLNDRLKSLDRFEVVIDLAGTLEKPEAAIQSDLGSQFAAMISESLQETRREVAQAKAGQIQTILDQRMSELDQVFTKQSREILAMLSDEVVAVADLQKLAEPGTNNIPRFR